MDNGAGLLRMKVQEQMNRKLVLEKKRSVVQSKSNTSSHFRNWRYRCQCGWGRCTPHTCAEHKVSDQDTYQFVTGLHVNFLFCLKCVLARCHECLVHVEGLFR